jgi:hypothetical protein
MTGFGTARLINCALDAHKPSVFTATVLDRQIVHGRSRTYLLDLSPWGPRSDEQQVEVSPEFYHNVADGDTVKVNFKPGLLLIPWYYLSKKSDPVQ